MRAGSRAAVIGTALVAGVVGLAVVAIPQASGASAVGSSACDPGAEAPAPTGDARYLAVWRDNPASHAAAPGVVPLSAVDAATLAKAFGSQGQPATLAAAPSGGVKMSWARAAASLGDDVAAGIVSPRRCVWLVTVHGTFTPRSVPQGVTPPVYSSFTTAFDVATGQYLETAAGANLPDVLTGTNVAADTTS